MVDALSDGYFELRQFSNSLYLSEAIKSKLGYNTDNNVNLSNIVNESSLESLRKITNLQPNEKLEISIALNSQNHQVHWFLCKCRAYKNNDDITIEGQFIDIGEIKKLELDLKTRMKQISQSNETLEDFSYITSHYLKAPLRHSMHTLELVREAQASNNNNVSELLSNLSKHLYDLKALIDEIIRFSRYKTQELSLSTININTLIDDLNHCVSDKISNKSVQIQCSKIPSIIADFEMIKTLLLNILQNACEYNENTVIEIDIRVQFEKEYLLVTIADNGIGFDIKHVNEVFKPFRRLVKKDQYPGFGIGLAICKIIMEQHGGEIQARSVVGKGSEFLLYFPIEVVKGDKPI